MFRNFRKLRNSQNRPLALICLPLLLSAICTIPVHATDFVESKPKDTDSTVTSAKSNRDIVNLFRDEMQSVNEKLKWRGERLPEDTIYAAALTGLSWQPAWGKSPLFSMQWGDFKKADTLVKRRKPQEITRLIESVAQKEQRGDAKGTVALAEANFTASEIALNPTLKQAVGKSLRKLGQLERAYNVYAAPFDAGKGTHEADDPVLLNREFRLTAFQLAETASQRTEDESETYRRNAVAFALSLLLQPDTDERALNRDALNYLTHEGVDLDRVALGILQAPNNLPGLPEYAYVASDLLLLRATPRLLPYLMHLAQSNDTHLRGRSVVALAMLAYQRQSGDAAGWSLRLVPNELKEYGLSNGERKMIAQEATEAVRSDNYRLRMAGCVALGLLGDAKSIPILQKLTKDPAYTLSPQIKGMSSRHIEFPVRAAACAAAYRFGYRWNPGGGDFSGKTLDLQRQGGQDVTQDRRNLKKEMIAPLRITPLDKYDK